MGRLAPRATTPSSQVPPALTRVPGGVVLHAGRGALGQRDEACAGRGASRLRTHSSLHTASTRAWGKRWASISARMPDPVPMSKIWAGDWASENRNSPAQLPKIRASVPTFIAQSASCTSNCLKTTFLRPDLPTFQVFFRRRCCHVSKSGKSSTRLPGSASNAETSFAWSCMSCGSF